MFRFNILLSLIFLFVSSTYGAPLSTAPTVDEGRTRLILDARTDLWIRPTQDKLEPVRIFDTEFRVPLYHNEGWTASALAHFEALSLGRTDIRIGPQNVVIGSSLRSGAMGLGLRRTLSNSGFITGNISFRSASDEPFKDSRDQWTEVSVLYYGPINDHGFQWIALVNQSKNRGFYNGQWFPFIGAHVDVSPEFGYSIGLPFLRLTWKKDSGFNSNIVFTPTGFNGVISQRVTEHFLSLFHFGLATYSYLHSNRVRAEERTFFQEKYGDVGFEYILTEDTKIGMAVGASVDRVVYSGENVFEADSARNRLTNDFYGRLILEFNL